MKILMNFEDKTKDVYEIWCSRPAALGSAPVEGPVPPWAFGTGAGNISEAEDIVFAEQRVPKSLSLEQLGQQPHSWNCGLGTHLWDSRSRRGTGAHCR